MSIQMLHAILYEADEYLLLYSEPGHVFHPKQFGITTEKLSSACLRGFDCTFEIKDGGLFLASLEVRAKDGLYPLINDTPPAFPGGVVEGHSWSAIYTDIGRLSYSGTLRFGRDQDRTYHVSMLFGYSVWMFCRVHEVVIVDGHVRSVTDISAEMAKVRARQPYSATVKAEGERIRKVSADFEKPFDKSNKRSSRKKHE